MNDKEKVARDNLKKFLEEHPEFQSEQDRIDKLIKNSK